eukprot:Clim_evm10s164 gene=Clim_evmTU10s164
MFKGLFAPSGSSQKDDMTEDLSKTAKKHREYYDAAYYSLSNAIQLDQAGKLKESIEDYEEGIRQLEAGIELYNSSLKTVVNDDVKACNEKMHKTLKNARERLRDLRDKRNTQREERMGVGQGKPGTKQSKGLSQANPLKNIDNRMAHAILDEIIPPGDVLLSDVKGLKEAKDAIYETVILPAVKPDIFTGLRAPDRGILLFGPPGNGKTFLAKAAASEANANFFSISAATLTSKFYGEGEKLIRVLFEMARQVQPSVIFLDEIDSILTERSSGENDASRRLKTEFLLRFDGVSSSSDDKILVLGATNRPWDLDDAVLRRFTKRIYVPLPDVDARSAILEGLLTKHRHRLSSREVCSIASSLQNYSAADIGVVAKEAAMAPVREIPVHRLRNLDKDAIRSITARDFDAARRSVNSSVRTEMLRQYDNWNREYGFSRTFKIYKGKDRLRIDTTLREFGTSSMSWKRGNLTYLIKLKPARLGRHQSNPLGLKTELTMLDNEATSLSETSTPDEGIRDIMLPDWCCV